MLKIVGIAVIVLLVVAAGILIHAAAKPNDFRARRTSGGAPKAVAGK